MSSQALSLDALIDASNSSNPLLCVNEVSLPGFTTASAQLSVAGRVPVLVCCDTPLWAQIKTEFELFTPLSAPNGMLMWHYERLSGARAAFDTPAEAAVLSAAPLASFYTRPVVALIAADASSASWVSNVLSLVQGLLPAAGDRSVRVLVVAADAAAAAAAADDVAHIRRESGISPSVVVSNGRSQPFAEYFANLEVSAVQVLQKTISAAQSLATTDFSTLSYTRATAAATTLVRGAVAAAAVADAWAPNALAHAILASAQCVAAAPAFTPWLASLATFVHLVCEAIRGQATGPASQVEVAVLAQYALSVVKSMRQSRPEESEGVAFACVRARARAQVAAAAAAAIAHKTSTPGADGFTGSYTSLFDTKTTAELSAALVGAAAQSKEPWKESRHAGNTRTFGHGCGYKFDVAPLSPHLPSTSSVHSGPVGCAQDTVWFWANTAAAAAAAVVDTVHQASTSARTPATQALFDAAVAAPLAPGAGVAAWRAPATSTGDHATAVEALRILGVPGSRGCRTAAAAAAAAACWAQVAARRAPHPRLVLAATVQRYDMLIKSGLYVSNDAAVTQAADELAGALASAAPRTPSSLLKVMVRPLASAIVSSRVVAEASRPVLPVFGRLLLGESSPDTLLVSALKAIPSEPAPVAPAAGAASLDVLGVFTPSAGTTNTPVSYTLSAPGANLTHLTVAINRGDSEVARASGGSGIRTPAVQLGEGLQVVEASAEAFGHRWDLRELSVCPYPATTAAGDVGPCTAAPAALRQMHPATTSTTTVTTTTTPPARAQLSRADVEPPTSRARHAAARARKHGLTTDAVAAVSLLPSSPLRLAAPMLHVPSGVLLLNEPLPILTSIRSTARSAASTATLVVSAPADMSVEYRTTTGAGGDAFTYDPTATALRPATQTAAATHDEPCRWVLPLELPMVPENSERGMVTILRVSMGPNTPLADVTVSASLWACDPRDYENQLAEGATPVASTKFDLCMPVRPSVTPLQPGNSVLSMQYNNAPIRALNITGAVSGALPPTGSLITRPGDFATIRVNRGGPPVLAWHRSGDSFKDIAALARGMGASFSPALPAARSIVLPVSVVQPTRVQAGVSLTAPSILKVGAAHPCYINVTLSSHQAVLVTIAVRTTESTCMAVCGSISRRVLLLPYRPMQIPMTLIGLAPGRADLPEIVVKEVVDDAIPAEQRPRSADASQVLGGLPSRPIFVQTE